MTKGAKYEPASLDTVQYEPLDNAGELRADASSMYEGRWRDWGFSILFLIHLITIAVLAAVYHGDPDINGNDDTEAMYGAVGSATALAVLVSVVWMVMIYQCPTTLIWISLIFSVLLFTAWTAIMAYQAQYATAIIFGLLTALQVCWIYCVRHRIALASTMLQIAVEVARTFWGIFIASVCVILVAVALLALWGYSFISVFQRLDNDDYTYAAAVGFIFSLFWIVNVKRYVVHCTAAGVTGTWYFSVDETSLARRVETSNVNASYASICRAMTTSFGSICYGALVISLIETMKVLARSMMNSDNGCQRFVGCCIWCILSCIEDIVEYINSYAFTICAIYGDNYCSAVNRTMNLFQHNGFDMIINDDLIESVLFFGALGCGVLSAGIAYVVALNASDTDRYTALFAGFVIGLGIIGIVNAAIVAIVKSIYVCFALDPLVMYNTKRFHYDKMMAAWSSRWGRECGCVPCEAYLERANVPAYHEEGAPPEYGTMASHPVSAQV